MTAINYELNPALAEQLDMFNELVRQRDSARRWAVELLRRVDAAVHFIEGDLLGSTELGDELLAILSGDLA